MTNYHTPDPEAWVSISNRAWQLIDAAEQAGIVLEISTQPYKPLAMGHGIMMVDMRPARILQPKKLTIEDMASVALERVNEAMSRFNDPHIIRVAEVFAELVLSTRSVEVTHLPSDDTEGGSHD